MRLLTLAPATAPSIRATATTPTLGAPLLPYDTFNTAWLKGFNNVIGTALTGRTIEGIKDGTSNTILFSEMTGGNSFYVRPGRTVQVLMYDTNGGVPPAGTNIAPYAGALGGTWASFVRSFMNISGSQFSGFNFSSVGQYYTGKNSTNGTCAINCANFFKKGFFSFHPGGVNSVLCDGGVRFLSENTTPFVLCSMLTARNGEPFDMP